MAKGRIIIVEDEYILARDIQSQLEAQGYAVEKIIGSGEDAIRLAGNVKPDLFLMDIRLHGEIDGIEAARQIREKHRIPVVYLTAYGDDGTLERAKITEPFGYLIKPFDNRELNAVIEMALYKAKMENTLREREAWFSTTLRSLRDGVIATDNEGQITFMNSTAAQLTGWRVEDAIGRMFSEVYQIVEEETKKPIDRSLNEVMEHIETEAMRHSVLRSQSGKEVYVVERASPIRDEQKNVFGVVLVFQDVTEQKKTEIKVRELEKLQVFGQLASGVAHEVRNPLNAILAITEALVQDLGENPEYKPYLDHICTQVDRLSTLMKELLELGRPIEPSSFQEEDLVYLIRSAVSLWEQTTSQNVHEVKLKGRRKSQPIQARVNPTKMQQVFFNLLENAAQHSPEESTITIEMAGLKNKSVRIRVVDGGTGIPPENLKKIFDPFFTTRRGGTGFGLSLVKRIVEMHKGIVAVSNNDPPPGCTVEIVLPRA